MKTLINKTNPQIRITAPEITTAHPPVSNEGYVYWIPAINEMYNPIDWTLVEEEYIENRNDGTYTFINTEEEPVDLEKEAVAFCFDNGINITPYQATRIARHFYELGLKRKEE